MNRRKLLFTGFSFVLLIVLLIGCDKKVGKIPTTPVAACDTITYEKHIKPIIDAKCNSCHGNPLSGGAPIPLVTYFDVKAAGDDGSLKKTVIDGMPVMPYGGSPLPKEEQDKISCWLNNGKKQN